MAITKDNFIVVYDLGDLDSAAFAAYYAGKHSMDTSQDDPSVDGGYTDSIEWQVNGQLVGIRFTDTSEILSSESVFNTQLLNPLSEALSSSSLQDRTIWGVVIGYGVPGGFYDGNDVIATTSRVSRINHAFVKQLQNKLYNRSVFQRFNSTDASFSLICSRIDAPTLLAAKAYVDNAEELNNQVFANGTFYIDPYSDRADAGTDEYQEQLVDFKDNLLTSLNLDTWSTIFMDPYIDVVVPFVEDDSFVWSWFTDRSTSSFFQYSNAIRVFFYNADYDGGFTMRNENGTRWPYLAMDAGYVATAGSMSNPTIFGFLNPKAFFNALLRGATIGEAYMFAVPHVNWTISLFGDPLTYCSFPASEVEDENEIDEHVVWDNMAQDLGKAAAHLYKKEQELKDVALEIVDITTSDPSLGATDAAVTLLYPANDLYVNNKEEEWTSQIKPLVDTLFDFPRLRYQYHTTDSSDTLAPDINDYLTDQGFKVSRILASITGSAIIDDDNLLDEGWWRFEFIIRDDVPNAFVNYHFKLEVADDSDFSTILMTKDSYSIRNWTYEQDKNVFVPVTYSGVTSSYIGRRVRYESRQDPLISLDDYLTRGETYYFRVTQYNAETSVEYSPREYSEIIYT